MNHISKRLAGGRHGALLCLQDLWGFVCVCVCLCFFVCVCEDVPHFQYGSQDLCAKVQSLQQFNEDRVQGLQSRVFELEKMLEVKLCIITFHFYLAFNN